MLYFDINYYFNRLFYIEEDFYIYIPFISNPKYKINFKRIENNIWLEVINIKFIGNINFIIHLKL